MPYTPRPIGVFDSGLGGLTIVKAIRKILPHEDIVYFGDLARLPYGIKSRTQIIAFSFQNARFLLKRKVKAIVIACNSSSSAAHLELKLKLPVPVINVIEPACKEAVRVTKNKRVGVIATQATVEAGTYEKTLKRLEPKIKVISQACPMFVPMVEEGWLTGKIPDQIATHYLLRLKKSNIDTLILGCTHYPLLKETIQKFIPHLQLVDSGHGTALQVAETLQKQRPSSPRKGRLSVFVSDKPRNFIRIGEQFLGEPLGKVEIVRNED